MELQGALGLVAGLRHQKAATVRRRVVRERLTIISIEQNARIADGQPRFRGDVNHHQLVALEKEQLAVPRPVRTDATIPRNLPLTRSTRKWPHVDLKPARFQRLVRQPMPVWRERASDGARFEQ